MPIIQAGRVWYRMAWVSLAGRVHKVRNVAHTPIAFLMVVDKWDRPSWE